MKKIAIIILVSLFITSCNNDKKIETNNDNKFITVENHKSKHLDSLFSELYSQGKFNGNVLIAENDTIIFKNSYGFADVNSKRTLNSETIFELASVTKQFTAMAIYILSKEAKLSLNDTISKYIPELKAYKGITIQNLIHHTGGLPDYMPLAEKYWDKSKIATNDDILKLFQQKQPTKSFEPNEKWEYSNTGYLVLASIIERVSGKKYGKFLEEVIFRPLKMKKTFVYRRRYQPRKINNYANGYFYSDSLKKLVTPDELGKDFYVVYLDGIVGDGMVNSNIIDLYKWDKALLKNNYINEDDKKIFFFFFKTNDNKNTNYGFGWLIVSPNTYGKIINHSGGWGGYISWNENHLDNNKTIIILQNVDKDEKKMPINNTRKIVYNKPIEKPIKLDTLTLKKYSGIYLKPNGEKEKIIYENTKLYIERNSVVKLELIPVSKTKFIADGFTLEVSYEFSSDKNGNIIKLRIQQEATGIDKEYNVRELKINTK